MDAKSGGSLIDSGANGGMAGNDVRVMDTSFATANVTGVAENTVEDLPICTVSGGV